MTDMSATDPASSPSSPRRDRGTDLVKRGLAEMLRGGVIMDVVNAEQAKVAEDAGAVAVMALERVPSDIRRDGGVARMSDPALIEGIKEVVTIPVMAKARIGHFAEAQVLESLGVDYIDESEVLTPADEANHIDKWGFTAPFVCGATNLGEALRRISEGAAMIRSKGEAGTGDIKEAVRHLRQILGDIRKITQADSAEIYGWAKELRAPVGLVTELAETGRLPVPLFCARQMPRWSCSWAPRPPSSGPGSSRAPIRPASGGPSSRPPRTSATRRSWPRSVVAWVTPCGGRTRHRWRPAWPTAANSDQTWARPGSDRYHHHNGKDPARCAPPRLQTGPAPRPPVPSSGSSPCKGRCESMSGLWLSWGSPPWRSAPRPNLTRSTA
jgi:pyridoxal 5'-phosphate synthase pdxS subunit